MATIETRQTKDGKLTYRARVRLLGQPERTKTFSSKTHARNWTKAIESDLERGSYVPTTEAARRTVAEMIDRYIEEILPVKPRNRARADHARHLRWWKERIGDYTLVNLKPDVIADYKLKLQREKIRQGKKITEKTRSASTVNHYIIDLSAVCKTATVEWHWIERNPVSNVSRLAEPPGRIRFLSDEERTALLDACAKNPDLLAIVILALATGARRGEILGMRWRHVDLKRGVVVLHDTKNRERRVLPLHGPALAMMKERAKVRRLHDDRVFPSQDKTDAEFNLRRCWPEALKGAGIENFRFHDLRHSCASYLAMNGASLAEIAEVLGHKTLAMVKRYAHLSDSHVSGVVERMNKAIFAGKK